MVVVVVVVFVVAVAVWEEWDSGNTSSEAPEPLLLCYVNFVFWAYG